jgi:hypothetical protein
MAQSTASTSKLLPLVLALIALALLGAALLTDRWFLSALPVGFLFGFFLHKGDLCGASAMSEVLAFRDRSKLLGLWVTIVVGMLGFAAGDLLGLVTLTPKPLQWALNIVGGLVFGAGTVLAGGCVSGCLFKAAAGNLNSIVALLAMPMGIALVEYGPLKALVDALKPLAIAGPGGKALDLPGLLHLPYALLAAVFAAATLGPMLWRRRGPKAASTAPAATKDALLKRLLFKPWKPWQAGLAIGLLALPAFVSSVASGRNYPLGVTHGVLNTQVLLTEADVIHVTARPAPAPAAATTAAPATTPAKGKKVVWWLVLVVLGLVLGAHSSARLTGQFKLLPKPPEQTLVAIVGGFVVGAGAALGGGCVVGNIMSGWALMSVGMLLFGVCTLVGNWAVTYFYLMGGSLGRG